VRFRHVERAWSPERPVSTYLNPLSRRFAPGISNSDWVSLVARRWNGESGPYSPAFFEGVEWRGKVDKSGMRIYDATLLAEALAS
jgi:hypothetical protein